MPVSPIRALFKTGEYIKLLSLGVDTLIVDCVYPYHAEKLQEHSAEIKTAAKSIDNEVKHIIVALDTEWAATAKQDAETKQEAEAKARADAYSKDFQVRAVEQEKATRNNWVKLSNVPMRGSVSTFENFDKTLQPLAYRRSLEFTAIKHGEKAEALVLCASVYGCGKTHLLTAICNYLINNTQAINTNGYQITLCRVPVFYITEPDLMTKIRNTYQNNSQESELQVFAELNSYPLLLIDDVGKVQPKDLSFVQQVYYRLVEYRYSEMKSIALATNLENGEFDNFIGGAVASRLAEMTMGKYFITMKGQDFRMAKVKAAGKK